MNENSESLDLVKIQAYNKGELIKIYKTGYKTFQSWIEPHLPLIGDYRGKCYTPAQVKIIFSLLGHP